MHPTGCKVVQYNSLTECDEKRGESKNKKAEQKMHFRNPQGFLTLNRQAFAKKSFLFQKKKRKIGGKREERRTHGTKKLNIERQRRKEPICHLLRSV